jgi:hypothetical protein
MSKWNADTAKLSPQEKQIERLIYFLMDHKLPGIGQHVGKTFSLYRFLQKHKGEANLSRRVVSQGKPIFTKSQLETALLMLTATPAKSAKQHGGSAPVVPAGTAVPVGTAVSAGTDFFDKILNHLTRKLTSFTTSTDPSVARFSSCLFSFPSLPGVEPILYFFSLCLFLPWHAEQIPVAGPLVFSPLLDSATLGLPASTELLKAGLGMLAVVPVVGSFATVAAASASTILMSITTLLNLSRKQYGSAFQTSLGIVPQFGGSLMEAAQQFEKALARIQTRIDKVVVPLQGFTATGAAAIKQYVPSMDEYEGPPVPLNMETVEKIKGEVIATLQEKAKQDPRIQQLQTLLQTVTTQVAAFVPPPVIESLKKGDVLGAARALQTAVIPPQLMDSLGKLREVVTALSTNPVAGVAGSLPSMPTMPTMPAMPTMPTIPSVPAVKAASKKRKLRKTRRTRRTRR